MKSTCFLSLSTPFVAEYVQHPPWCFPWVKITINNMNTLFINIVTHQIDNNYTSSNGSDEFHIVLVISFFPGHVSILSAETIGIQIIVFSGLYIMWNIHSNNYMWSHELNIKSIHSIGTTQTVVEHDLGYSNRTLTSCACNSNWAFSAAVSFLSSSTISSL